MPFKPFRSNVRGLYTTLPILVYCLLEFKPVGNTKGQESRGKDCLGRIPGHLYPFDPLTLCVEFLIHLSVERLLRAIREQRDDDDYTQDDDHSTWHHFETA